MVNRKLWYLIKWEGFGIEHNSWEPWNNVHAPELVMEFYQKHPGAARQIRALDFTSIPFRSIPSSIVPGRHSVKGGVDVRGHSIPSPTSPFHSISGHMSGHSVPIASRSISGVSVLTYIPPHRR